LGQKGLSAQSSNGIRYDDIEIRKLSPGTRGIVLVLLYLALDDADDRPLIIDQPEENLDPKSIYDELVPLFQIAKRSQQVIIVTHNANLVVNTDADQIIVAEVGAHTSAGLPPITYRPGGLEQASIRKMVCDTLEGGEQAFLDRARRLHIPVKLTLVSALISVGCIASDSAAAPSLFRLSQAGRFPWSRGVRVKSSSSCSIKYPRLW